MGLFWRVSALAAASLLAVAGPGRPVHASPMAGASSFNVGRQMLTIVNADRQAAGLRPLVFDVSEAAVARQHSYDMAVHNYFSHIDRGGSSPFDRLRHAGITYRVAGENLGIDSGQSRAAMLRAIEVAMMHSPEHRANLLRPTFSTAGIGIVIQHGVMYVTEDFTG